MRREVHFSLVILVATKIAGLALTTRIEEILGGFILTRLLQFLSNSEKCVSCRDKMYVHVQQDDDKDMEMFYFMTALDARLCSMKKESCCSCWILLLYVLYNNCSVLSYCLIMAFLNSRYSRVLALCENFFRNQKRESFAISMD